MFLRPFAGASPSGPMWGALFGGAGGAFQSENA